MPQAPQLALDVKRLVSQPGVAGLQSPQPASQVHWPLTQCSCAAVEHFAPHLPQLTSDAIRLTSQPARRSGVITVYNSAAECRNSPPACTFHTGGQVNARCREAFRPILGCVAAQLGPLTS